MNKTEVMKQLEAMGSAQTRKTYMRHGLKGPMYGVSYANLGKLRRAIKIDHALAQRLWATNNLDARVLATMIADPAQMTAADLDDWLVSIEDHGMAGAFCELAYRAPAAVSVSKRWRRSRDEIKSICGWNVTGHLASHAETIDEDALEAALETIEAKIHSSPNFTRYAMNCALIAIGRRTPRLRRTALAAAKRIGPVEVDHGNTACKTPDAATAIRKKRR
jgi:3-methyladenine DNA glycosylase AlkD